MKKNELRKQLEELYFQGLVNGEWDLEYPLLIDPTLKGINYDYNFKIEKIESLLYSKVLDSKNMTNKVPWKNAVKRYQIFIDTPLYKALQEEE